MQTTIPARAPMAVAVAVLDKNLIMAINLKFLSPFLRRVPVRCRFLATDNTAAVAWFVDQEYEKPHPQSRENIAPPAPTDAPAAVKLVHETLARSAHLSKLVTKRAKEIPFGPPLPLKAPQGRRKRGSTFAGESMFDIPGNIWSWTVMAQVGAASNYVREACPEEGAG